jgi:hypothetical protein
MANAPFSLYCKLYTSGAVSPLPNLIEHIYESFRHKMNGNHVVLMLLPVRGTWNIEVAADGKRCMFGCSHHDSSFISKKTRDSLRDLQIHSPLHVQKL